MNRLNKTKSAIFILYFGLVALKGSTFHQNFYYHNVPKNTLGECNYYTKSLSLKFAQVDKIIPSHIFFAGLTKSLNAFKFNNCRFFVYLKEVYLVWRGFCPVGILSTPFGHIKIVFTEFILVQL